jgi:hypothetical protein
MRWIVCQSFLHSKVYELRLVNILKLITNKLKPMKIMGKIFLERIDIDKLEFKTKIIDKNIARCSINKEIGK